MTQATPVASIDLNRRRMGCLALGGVAALMLGACGGGSGGDGGGSSIDLRQAYDKIVAGMDKEDVTAVVGRVADGISPTGLDWDEGGQTLRVLFNRANDVVGGATWYSGTQRLSKSFPG